MWELKANVWYLMVGGVEQATIHEPHHTPGQWVCYWQGRREVCEGNVDDVQRAVILKLVALKISEVKALQHML